MTKCRACNATLIPFFSLGQMPLVNSFLRKKDIANEKRFDLSLGFCPNCYLVQLLKTIDPKDLFRNYIYFSSEVKTILAHNQKTADYLIKRLGLGKDSLVLEIGSNDGAHLQYYKECGIGILGIDPAKNIARVANERGIPTIPEFFNATLAEKLRKQRRLADLVYGANVAAHVPEILDFVKGVSWVLKEKGTAIFEFPYLAGLFENKFDTIYHEHVFYYGLIALQNLFKQVGLTIYDVEHIPMQGGSLRIFICHAGVFQSSRRVENLAGEEEKRGFTNIATYKNIEKNVQKLKNDLVSLLTTLKKEGKKIGGYGAPAKGNILLNYFGIASYLDFLVDKGVVKQGLYAPGTHLLVENPGKIRSKKPDYLLILCWNIADEVMQEWNEFKKQRGKFIIPIPKVKIL